MGSAEEERTLLTAHREHLPALLSYVCRLLGGDRHEAEDIVQETLIRCWHKYGSRDESMLRPWLFTVARNLVIDSHRRSEARPHQVDGAAWLDQEASELDHIERMLSSVVVAEGLKTLSEAHYSVLYETYFLNKTLEDTARTLAVPVGTVKSRLFYGLRALRHALHIR
ncbi:sigma-70 family RNA polymerase sigma factor [Streptomyces sp. NPDC001858]